MTSGAGLVFGEGDTRALAAAYTHYLKESCRQFCAIGPQLPAAMRPAHAAAAAVLRGALRREPRRVLGCFASPTVGAPLQCIPLQNGMAAFRSRIEQAAAAMVPHLLLELAARQLFDQDESVVWEHGAPPLASLPLGGELISPEGATALRFAAGHLAALRGGAELARLPTEPAALQAALAAGDSGFSLQRRFWRTGKATFFATVDHNPIAAFEAHPEKAGNLIDLGGRTPEQWVEVLDQCFALVERYLPAEHGAMGLVLHAVVPVGYDDVRHLSASYREAIGTIYLTLHPNLMTMTEAVIHEFQHNKLNVGSYSADFLVNAFEPLYKSPVRPDPRPLWGILLAVHAFLPVAELYRRMRDDGHPWAATPEFQRRMSDIDLKNHEGMDMLRAHAEFTAAGRALFAELEALESAHLADRRARGLATEPVSAHPG